MIDIVTEKGRYLKNLRQIGTPEDQNRIYIEDDVCRRLRSRENEEKTLFVLMGHTECNEGLYETFVEGYIQVTEIGFDRNTPVWTNSTWSKVFQKIKQHYEDSIIVGWAYRNMTAPVRITPELESLHREHFGGVHQIFMLLNPLMQEEFVYTYQKNSLQPRQGFFIYYDPSARKHIEVIPPKEIPVELAHEVEPEARPQGVYRDILKQQNTAGSSRGLSYALVCILCLMIAIMGISIFKDKDKLGKIEASIDAITGNDKKNELIIETTSEEADEKIPVIEAPKDTEDASSQNE